MLTCRPLFFASFFFSLAPAGLSPSPTSLLLPRLRSHFHQVLSLARRYIGGYKRPRQSPTGRLSFPAPTACTALQGLDPPRPPTGQSFRLANPPISPGKSTIQQHTSPPSPSPKRRQTEQQSLQHHISGSSRVFFVACPSSLIGTLEAPANYHDAASFLQFSFASRRSLPPSASSAT